MDLSVIIVNYNTKDLLLQTLHSVYQTRPGVEMEVFVVDNASTDGSQSAVAEQFPQALLRCKQTNTGFADANNFAIREAKGRYILLLNSDTIVHESTFLTMIDFMDQNPRAGAAGCKVVLPDGRLDLACKRSFPTPMNALYQAVKLDKLFPASPRFAAYNLTYLDEDETHEVECLVGAFMMVRREVVQEVGGLDDTFFMYGEDIDWCYRIKQAGWQIWYYPAASIIHYKGASSKKKKVRMIYEFHRAMHLYYNKHHAKQAFWLVNGLVYLGIWCRYLMVAIANLFKKRGLQDDKVLSGIDQSNTHSA